MKIIKALGILGPSINLLVVLSVSIETYMSFSYALNDALPAVIITSFFQIVGLAGVFFVTRAIKVSLILFWVAAIGTSVMVLLSIFSIGLFLSCGAGLLWSVVILIRTEIKKGTNWGEPLRL